MQNYGIRKVSKTVILIRSPIMGEKLIFYDWAVLRFVPAQLKICIPIIFRKISICHFDYLQERKYAKGTKQITEDDYAIIIILCVINRQY